MTTEPRIPPCRTPRRERRPPFFLLGAVAVAVVALVATLAACGGAQTPDAEKRHAFFVRSALAPPPAGQSGSAGCVYTSGPDQATLFKGRVDLGVAATYQLALLVEASEPTTTMTVTGAHVVLTQGDKTLSDTETVANAFIDAGKAAVVLVGMFDPASRDELDSTLRTRLTTQLVVAKIELRGRNPSGGGDLASPVFSFPIQVCSGCLVDFSTGNDSTAAVQPNCLRPPGPDTRRPCFLGQDEPVPCQLCIGTNVACDPVQP